MLDRLLDLGKRVLAEGDLDRALALALDGVIELCGAERGMILLFDTHGEVIFEQARKLERADLARPELEVSRGILERVRASGQPVAVDNALADPAVGARQSVLRLGILSVLCLPLRHEGEVFGVVYLDHRRRPAAFGPEQLELAASFSELISLAAHHALERRRLSQQVERLAEDLRQRYRFEAILGQEPQLLAVLERVAQVADTQVTVLIQGETGTGKELVARALHANSRRRGGPFVAINCGALPENLLEAELFGYVRGAFTGAVRDHAGWFERADGGTIFLDEVGEMPPALQVRLLRVLETREYARVGSTALRRSDARVVAATHRRLDALVAEGKLREDLYYRLNVVDVTLPPLRERRGDVPLLARHFLARAAEQLGRPEKALSRAAEAALLAHDFPGNLRELQNALQRALLVARGAQIEIEDLPEPLRARPALASAAPDGLDFKAAKQRVVEDFERDFLRRALEAAGGNISQAARTAGLDFKNLHAKLAAYGIDPAAYKRRGRGPQVPMTSRS
ncbi:MAG TPA: sigma-54-dependent Fis family transcriptional regulator [Thermoanaerobaculia bacterium]|nr:sigma-54-dependent Fis family transcriptional regulator [Thermoanaerobaculia bacterium]